jgi:hypothetical protein
MPDDLRVQDPPASEPRSCGAFPFLRSNVQGMSPKRKRGRAAVRPRLRFGLTKHDLRDNGNASLKLSWFDRKMANR